MYVAGTAVSIQPNPQSKSKSKSKSNLELGADVDVGTEGGGGNNDKMQLGGTFSIPEAKKVSLIIFSSHLISSHQKQKQKKKVSYIHTQNLSSKTFDTPGSRLVDPATSRPIRTGNLELCRTPH